jgi:hypothetical protein
MPSQPNMYALQYLVPDKYPAADGSFDPAISDMCATLRSVSTRDTAVPHSALSVRLTVMLNGSTLEIKKRGQPVYMNLFCFDTSHLESMLAAAEELYRQFGLGTPKRPKVPTWIHSVPVTDSILRPNEIVLCQKMTVSFFWAVYSQRLKRSNPMN